MQYSNIIARGLQRTRKQPSAIDYAPATNISLREIDQTTEKIIVRFEVPGFGQEDLALETTTETVRLRVRKRDRQEGARDRFDDLVATLPDEIDPANATASLENGVLTVELTKLGWLRGTARRVTIYSAESIPTSQPKPEKKEHDA